MDEEEISLSDDDVQDVVRAGSPRNSTPQLRRHLLILDMNGWELYYLLKIKILHCFLNIEKLKHRLLIDRRREPRLDAAGEAVQPDMAVGQFYVYDRPHLSSFVLWALRHFVVGVWSSARMHNLRSLVAHTFGAHAASLAFVWGQERCTQLGKAGKGRPVLLKELRLLWREPTFAPFGPNNTLLLDDDEYKASRNPRFTGVHPKKYEGESIDNALAEAGELRQVR